MLWYCFLKSVSWTECICKISTAWKRAVVTIWPLIEAARNTSWEHTVHATLKRLCEPTEFKWMAPVIHRLRRVTNSSIVITTAPSFFLKLVNFISNRTETDTLSRIFTNTYAGTAACFFLLSSVLFMWPFKVIERKRNMLFAPSCCGLAQQNNQQL